MRNHPAVDAWAALRTGQAVKILQARLTALDLSRHRVRATGDSTLELTLAGLDERAVKGLGAALARTGLVHFRIVEEGEAWTAFLDRIGPRRPSVDHWPEALTRSGVAKGTTAFRGTDARGDYVRSLDRRVLDYRVEGSLGPNQTVGYQRTTLSPPEESAAAAKSPPTVPPGPVHLYELYLLRTDEALDNITLANASVGMSESYALELYLRLRPHDKTAFHELTRRNVQRKLAIVVDDVVYQAPRISEPIGGGVVMISQPGKGSSMARELGILAAVLAGGPLPMPMQVQSESWVELPQ